MENIKFKKDKYEFTSISPIILMDSADMDNRSSQINLLIEDLNIYNVFLKDLVNFPLKEKERNIALNIAYYIIENEELKDNLNLTRHLNIPKLSRATKIKSDYIKKWKDYIIAYFIIINNPEYKFIQDYLKIKLNQRNKETRHKIVKQKTYRGIIIKALLHNSACILTSTGEFKKIKLNGELTLGSIGEGKKKTGSAIYKIPICILLLFLIIFGFNIYSKYTTASSIIVVQTTSNIKLHVNIYDRVIYAHSPTEKGGILVSSLDAQNRKIDDVIVSILEYGLKNKMVSPENTVYITVTGQPLKYGELPKTNKFVIENKIKVVINNSGVQQKLLDKINET